MPRQFSPAAMLALALCAGCDLFTDPPRVMAPQTVVLFSTPKIISDFDNPAADARAFLEHYEPLTSRAAETILVFAVGNSQHVLTYKGREHWADSVEWARFTSLTEVDSRKLRYVHIDGIVRAFRAAADTLGIRLKVFDQVDGGAEFVREYFKLNTHPECFPPPFGSFDIRGKLTADTVKYATAPGGTVAGTTCGRFLVDQMGAYVTDLGFDGMLYGNQLGTRGRWQPDAGPGYSDEEASAILEFFAYSKQVLGTREIIWFDSYNEVHVEHDTYSVPQAAYAHMDYILASGFCVISFPARQRNNLHSKTALRPTTKVLATLDYVDPWYEYNSKEDFPNCTSFLEQLAIESRFRIDGVTFFANDDHGVPVPKERIESFAQRFFGQ